MNMNAIFLIFIGTIVRFSYFRPKETIKIVTGENEGSTFEKTTSRERFMFYVTTIFVLPALIALYTIVELEIWKDIFGKNFHFLELPIGKGIYLLLLALMLLEKANAVEIIFGLAILVICVINIVVSFIKPKAGNDAGDEEDPLTGHAHVTQTDNEVGENIKENEKGEIVKPKNSKST